MYFKEVESGSSASIQLSKVHCPRIRQVVQKIMDCLELIGKVMALKCFRRKNDFYAVVQVCGIETPLVVSVNQLDPPELDDDITAEVSGQMVEQVNI